MLENTTSDAEDTTNDADSESDLEPVSENMPPDEQTDEESSRGICRKKSMRLFFSVLNIYFFAALCCV